MPRRPSRAARGRSSRSTGRTFLRGLACPGSPGVLHHDYPVTPGIVARAARNRGPDVVVVSGWSTFASQAAIAWCSSRAESRTSCSSRATTSARAAAGGAPSRAPSCRASCARQPVRSRSGRRRASRSSPAARDRERVRVFANTIDVAAWEERAASCAHDVASCGRELGAADDDVVVLSRRPARSGEGARRARPRRRGDAMTRGCWSSWPATARNARAVEELAQQLERAAAR